MAHGSLFDARDPLKGGIEYLQEGEIFGPLRVVAPTDGITLSKPPQPVPGGLPFLGSNCYIGSNSNPIQINLIAGTTSPPPPNQPITGAPGELGAIEEQSIIADKNNKLVNNSFAAPGANGCGGLLFSWAVDPFVNSIVGVPSAAGTNTAGRASRPDL